MAASNSNPTGIDFANLSPDARWVVAFAALWLTLAMVAETSFGELAAAVAALIASGATFAMLPQALRNLGFIK
jgi:hypothetical protein